MLGCLSSYPLNQRQLYWKPFNVRSIKREHAADAEATLATAEVVSMSRLRSVVAGQEIVTSETLPSPLHLNYAVPVHGPWNVCRVVSTLNFTMIRFDLRTCSKVLLIHQPRAVACQSPPRNKIGFACTGPSYPCFSTP